MAAALAVNVTLFGPAPFVLLAIVYVAARGAVLVVVITAMPAPPNAPGASWFMVVAYGMVDSRSSLCDYPMHPVPMVAAMRVVVMPVRQHDDFASVPIVVVAIVRTDMRNSAGTRDMPGSMTVVIVVERAVP